MTKKDKILKLFNNTEWLNSPSGRKTKIITSDDFIKNGLCGSWEYGEKYCDIIYAKTILQKIGYTVVIGIGFYVFEK